MTIATVNPATGETLRTFESLTASQLDEKLLLAARTFPTYRRVPFAQRSQFMQRAAGILESGKDHYARLMTLRWARPFARRARKCSSVRAAAAIMPRTASACWPEEVRTEAAAR